MSPRPPRSPDAHPRPDGPTYAPAPTVRWFDCLDGLVVGRLSDVSPRYLNGAGAAVWRGLVEHHLTVPDLCDELVHATRSVSEPASTERGAIEADVSAMIGQLLAHGLVVEAAPPPGPAWSVI